MKRIICIPFAYDYKMNSGVNLSQDAERLRIYLENATVALCSAKYYNEDCDVALVTNLSLEQIPKEIQNILYKSNVQILNVPFDCYRFSKDYQWQLAFYKLCVLSFLVKYDWNYICYMDTDVYVQSSFGAIWQECDCNILLYDINHGLNTKDYISINDEFTDFIGSNQLVTHYGGEFFAANRENAVCFEMAAAKVYKEMIGRGFVTAKGDEFIVSLVAKQMRDKVKNASPYIHRFWTGANFRLTSTCYKYNPVIVLHMPAEKEKGIITLYKHFFVKGVIPENKIVWKICRLNHQPLCDKIGAWIMNKIKNTN